MSRLLGALLLRLLLPRLLGGALFPARLLGGPLFLLPRLFSSPPFLTRLLGTRRFRAPFAALYCAAFRLTFSAIAAAFPLLSEGGGR